MQLTPAQAAAPPRAEPSADETQTKSPLPFDLQQLRQQIFKIADLLPSQGPISAFVFLNTLQALEDLSFDDGVREGARLFGCQPYLGEEKYRERLTSGRIRLLDVQEMLRDDLGDRADEFVFGETTRYDLRLAMLQHPLRSGPAEELRWFMDETDALKKLRPEVTPELRQRFLRDSRHWLMRDARRAGTQENYTPDALDRRTQELMAPVLQRYGANQMESWTPATWEACSLQALWVVCQEGTCDLTDRPPEIARPKRHRDWLLDVTGEDPDSLVHEVLIRFCAAFADQGFADWPLPLRDAGFFRSFCAVYGQSGGPPEKWLAPLSAELQRITALDLSPLESIQESLQLLGVNAEQQAEYLTATILALQGWAGLIWQMEIRGDRVAIAAPEGSLIEFVAIRLILDRLACAYVAAHALGYDRPLAELRDADIIQKNLPVTNGITEHRAYLVFQLAQILGWNTQQLLEMDAGHWKSLVGEIEAFHSFERRRLFHRAFEQHYRVQALDAISAHATKPARRVGMPRFQAVFCIDAREESFRRHLEEFAPEVETFGVAGFFGVAMYYRGVADANYATLCPIVVRPKHWVIEEVVLPFIESNRRRTQARAAIGVTALGLHRGSRKLAGGAILTATLGVLASVPLVARVLFPRWTGWITSTARSLVAPPAITRLRLERQTAEPGMADDQIGFTVDEMANLGERMLRDMGLTQNFARLVLFLGHGSHCLNNPHKSAYDCGACSGSPGGPNARALAAFLNDVRVREILNQRGLEIPRETCFLGGLHNTGSDTVKFFDLDLLPKSHHREFEQAVQTLESVCERNAHERCRRFFSAPLDITPAAAHAHVEARTEDLAQTRPEFGNASNAMCFVGRRSRVRGLYMDRRSFMHSYDFTTDDEESTILARILAPVVPVCQGINLQYFFSVVDSIGWGCGTKLPHNVTSLLGVMDGYASDLRPGLPHQGVEIHEPVRLLFVIETTPARMLSIMDRDPVVGRILKNGWAQLAVLDPFSNDLQVYDRGRFVPYVPEVKGLPHATSSVDWYRGWRDHLGFATIESLAPADSLDANH